MMMKMLNSLGLVHLLPYPDNIALEVVASSVEQSKRKKKKKMIGETKLT